MVVNADPPGRAELTAVLGAAWPVWTDLLSRAEAVHAPLHPTWRPSKTGFGKLCLLQQGKRTLLYLTPDDGRIWVALVLGERACQLALAGPLPAAIKQLLRDARPYAEGRGIRFSICMPEELRTVMQLLEVKTAPR